MRNSDNYGEITRKAKVKHGIWTGVKYFFLALWAIIVLFPFYWMVLTSLKDYGAYNSEYIPKFFTLYPTLANYAEAFTAVPLARYFMNTLLFTVVTTALMLIVITLAAFAFARLEFRGTPASVTAIEFGAFMGCDNLRYVLATGNKITTLGDNLFGDGVPSKLIYKK